MASLDNMDIVGQQMRVQLAALDAPVQTVAAVAEAVAGGVQERLDTDAGGQGGPQGVGGFVAVAVTGQLTRGSELEGSKQMPAPALQSKGCFSIGGDQARGGGGGAPPPPPPPHARSRADDGGGLKLTSQARAALMSRLATNAGLAPPPLPAAFNPAAAMAPAVPAQPQVRRARLLLGKCPCCPC